MATQEQIDAALAHINLADAEFGGVDLNNLPEGNSSFDLGKNVAGVIASTASGFLELGSTINDMGLFMQVRNAYKSYEAGYGWTGHLKPESQGGMPKVDYFSTAALLDNTLGTNYSDYYKENKTSIDAQSFIGQLIPVAGAANLATKGVNVASTLRTIDTLGSGVINSAKSLIGTGAKTNQVELAMGSAEVLSSGIVTNNMGYLSRLATNWEGAKTAETALAAAKNEGIWNALQSTRWKAVGANAGDTALQFAAADAIFTAATFYHPLFDGKNAEEKFSTLMWSPLIGAGFGALGGIAAYGNTLREVGNALNGIKEVSGYNKIADLFRAPQFTMGDELAGAYRLSKDYSNVLLKNDGTLADVNSVQGLVKQTIDNKYTKVLGELQGDKVVDTTAILTALRTGSLDADSVAHAFSGVTSIKIPEYTKPVFRFQKDGDSAERILASNLNLETGKLSDEAHIVIGDVFKLNSYKEGVATPNKFNEIANHYIVNGNSIPLRNFTQIVEDNADTLIATTNRIAAEREIIALSSKGNLNRAIDSQDVYRLEAAIRNENLLDIPIALENGKINILTKSAAGELLEEVKAAAATKLLESGADVEKVAILLNSPREAITTQGKISKYFDESGNNLIDASKQRTVRLEYGQVGNDASGRLKVVDGIEVNQWARRASAIREENIKLIQLASDDFARTTLGQELYDKLNLVRNSFNPTAINLQQTQGRGFVRGQNIGYMDEASKASYIQTLVSDEIGKIRTSLAKTSLATEVGIIGRNGVSSEQNLRIQQVFNKVFDHNFRDNGRLMYVRNSMGEVEGIVSKEMYNLQGIIPKLSQKLSAATTPSQQRIIGEKLAEAQAKLVRAEQAGFSIRLNQEDSKFFTALADATNSTTNAFNKHLNSQFKATNIGERVTDQVIIHNVPREANPHGVFLRRPPGSMFDDGELVLITGKSVDEAKTKAAAASKLFAQSKADPKIGTSVEMITSFDAKDAALFKQLENSYDYSQSFRKGGISEQVYANRGILIGDVGARPSFELLDTQLRGIERESIYLLKDSVEKMFAPQITQLKALDAVAKSGNEGIFASPLGINNAARKVFGTTERTPLGDVANMITGEFQSGRVVGTLWKQGQDIATGMIDRAIDSVVGAGKKLTKSALEKDYVQNYSKVLSDFGYDKNVASAFIQEYSNFAFKELYRTPEGTKYIQPAVDKLKTFISDYVVRYTGVNTILNELSMPISHTPVMREMWQSLAKDGRITQELRDYLGRGNDAAPGAFGYGKSFVKSVRDMHTELEPSEYIKTVLGGTGKNRREAIDSLGIIPTSDEIRKYLITTDNIIDGMRSGLTVDKAVKLSKEAEATLNGSIKNTIKEKLNKVNPLRAIGYGYDMTEYHVRYYMADVAARMAEFSKMSKEEALPFIHAAVGMATGMKHAAQRPQIFEGVVGSMATMFQSYSFNLAHIMAKSLEAGDKKGAMLMAALQAGIHGTTTIPGFNFLNSTIIGENNRQHGDIISTVNYAMPKPMADFALYGGGSSLFSMGLYGSADMTPRTLTIVPTSIKDFPALSILYNAYNSLHKGFSMALESSDAGFGAVGNAGLRALEHNGIWRPLGRLAERIQGYSTTTQQGTINMRYDSDPTYINSSAGLPAWLAKSMGMDADTAHAFSYVAAIAGTRSLNESIMRDGVYRYQKYQQADKAKQSKLSDAMANVIGSGKDIRGDEELYNKYLYEYIMNGGSQRGFVQALKRAEGKAGSNTIDRINDKLNTVAGQNMQLSIGGDIRAPRNTKDNYWYPGNVNDTNLDGKSDFSDE